MNKTLIIWDLTALFPIPKNCGWKTAGNCSIKNLTLSGTLQPLSHHLGGMSENQKEVLQQMGLSIDDNFADEALKMDFEVMKRELNRHRN